MSPQGFPGSAVRRSAVRPVSLVLLDVGGPIYDDASYARALLAGLRDLGAAVDANEFREVYDRQRQRQSGSLRQALTDQFLGGGDRGRLTETAARHWRYGPEDLHDDVLAAIAALASRYRLGVVANQRSQVRQALERDGVASFIDVWAISEDVGAEKPDPRIFQHALLTAGVPARDAVHVGNRLDTDVRGALRVGLRTVWLLRGEAPPTPTPEQRGEPDAVIAKLSELPAVLSVMEGGNSDE
jgi:HAD superfamily hydrolase (TIGR01549 family)